MGELLDRPRQVRNPLDERRLADYMGVKDLLLEQFPGGYSNLTYAVTAGAEEWVLRCPPPGVAVAGGHDVLREARLLAALSAAWPLAPRPALVCADATVLGVPFYLMQRLRGLIIRRDLPAGLDPAVMAGISRSLVEALAALHALDPAELGLSDFGRPDGYVRRQVEGWTRRLDAARTGEHPELDRLAAWLAENLPPDGAPALIHNDFKLDNVVLDPADPTRILGILDWEMAALGDPWMDVGTSLAYWVEAGDPPGLQAIRFGPTQLPAALTRQGFVDAYRALRGGPADASFYQAFGLFKVAVVGQQLFKRHVDGKSADPRFAHLDRAVLALARAAAHIGQPQR